MLQDLKKFTKTRKFWAALATGVVAYATAKFGATAEVALLVAVLGAFGVYEVKNEQ